jgi:hypothetical protein
MLLIVEANQGRAKGVRHKREPLSSLQNRTEIPVAIPLRPWMIKGSSSPFCGTGPPSSLVRLIWIGPS